MSDTIAYRLTNPFPPATADTAPILRVADGAFIPRHPANRDYQAFLEWVEAGNTPGPPLGDAGPPSVQLPQPTTLEADPYGDMDATTKRYVDEQIAQLAQTFRRA